MSKSKSKHNKLHYELEEDYAICFLSGEPIIRRKDFTTEHYCPKSRVPRYVWNSPYNLKPAIKIINNIKGNLMPCEWKEQRISLCLRALQRSHLDHYERTLLQKCVEKYRKEDEEGIDICQNCTLNYIHACRQR